MKKTVLSDEEIKKINNFVKEVSSIPAVRSVYLLPNLINEHNPQLEIIIIWSDSTNLYYNGLLTGKAKIKDTFKENMNLELLIEKYEQEFNCGKILITKEDSENFFMPFTSVQELNKETSLIDEILLFERFGDIKDNNDIATANLIPGVSYDESTANTEHTLSKIKKKD